MDSLICQSYFNSALITVLNMLLVGKQDNLKESSIKTSNLFKLLIPKAFIVKPSL